MVSSTRSDVSGIGESDAMNAGLSGDERRTLARALDFAASVYGDKLLGTGEPAYGHAIGLARNVAELRLDADARVAGLLFSVPEYLSDGEEKLAASFGAAVASLGSGISPPHPPPGVTPRRMGRAVSPPSGGGQEGEGKPVNHTHPP